MVLSILGGATCQGTIRPATLFDFSELGLDDLSDAARQSVQGAAEELRCPCGCGRTLSSGLASHTRCGASLRMIKLMGAMARLGATRSDIVQAVQEYYLSFGSPPVEVDLREAACKGSPQAPVTLVEFSDFECPHCSSLSRVLDALVSTHGEQMRLCFKHFPLNVHQRAFPAAQAAELARTQDRFWQVHDLIFEHQNALADEDLAGYIRLTGLNPEALARVFGEGTFLAGVQESKDEGKRLGVARTPFLFINGRPFTLPLDGIFLDDAIEDAAEWAEHGRWVCKP
jgi:hypothetical protein